MSLASLYDQVLNWEKQTALLESTQALLEWDERTGMPTEGGDYRADQVTFLSGLIHHRRTDASHGDRLEQLANSELARDPLSDTGATILRLNKDFQRRCRLPVELVQAISRATVLGQQAWSQARPNDDFAAFLPHLQNILKLRKEEAQLLAPLLQVHSSQSHQGKPNSQACEDYDALLDQYEEGATANELEKVFSDLREQLVPIVQRTSSSSHKPSGKSLQGSFPIEKQRQLSRDVAAQIGFRFEAGRLDETSHPFCTTVGPRDCRILTRYHENFFSSGFFGTLHEAGHGMYEQGLSSEHYALPLGSYVSLGIHESQSRLWENMVGRSLSFWKWCFPKTQKLFPEALSNVTLDQFYGDINRVAPSLIRVEADEATYNLHILIRFELERELLSGKLQPADLPDAWNDRYQRYLGIVPPDNRDGVLQDIHWSAGLVGYFPTYTLGNLYAAQLMVAARRDLGDLDSQFAQGNFAPLLDWMREHVHQHGKRYNPLDLLRKATGQELSATPFVEYLGQKLEPIHGLI